MRAVNLVPVFPELASELKDLMTSNRNGGHLSAAYVFGIVWANATNNVFTPNKSELAELYALDRKTLNKYLDELVNVGFLETNEDSSVYVISKSVRFQLTVQASRPHVDNLPSTGDMFPSGGGGDMFPTLGTCSPEIGDMFPTATPMIHDDHDIDIMGKINAIKSLWEFIGLDAKGKAFSNMVDLYADNLDALLDLSSAWAEWWQDTPEDDRIGYGLIYSHIKNGNVPPKPKAPETWFTQDELIYFER